uniref:hemerythrin domain-containing protein n=1 Tax=Glycomyces dulcitolivorans TaxID=2200759 RepID=UPI0018E59036
SASTEAADVVLTADRVDGLADALLIARRSGRIARAAAGFGMALSVAAMVPAAAGVLAPVAGAVLQEGIDIAAIMTALTVLLPGRVHTVTLPPQDLDVVRGLHAEHEAVAPLVERIREVADGLAGASPDPAPVRRLLDRLESELLPHERAEEARLVPVLDRAFGGPDPLGALSRSHVEIELQVRRVRGICDGLGDRPDLAEVTDLRGALYGLYAIARLHNAQEEENAFSLLPPPAPAAAPAGGRVRRTPAG